MYRNLASLLTWMSDQFKDAVLIHHLNVEASTRTSKRAHLPSFYPHHPYHPGTEACELSIQSWHSLFLNRNIIVGSRNLEWLYCFEGVVLTHNIVC